jgi:hypothetical protein
MDYLRPYYTHFPEDNILDRFMGSGNDAASNCGEQDALGGGGEALTGSPRYAQGKHC